VGAPTELLDEAGGIAWRTRRTLWGTTTWNADATAYTPLRFPGQYADPETGLHYNFHRHYDPTTARYLSPDPLGLDPAPNPVTYVHNPHTETDALGLAPDECPEKKKGGRAAQRRGEMYEEHLQDKLGGGSSFSEMGREFDGAFIDPSTGRGTWYEAKSGEYWERLERNEKALNRFFSKEGQKQQIAASKGVEFMVISERELPARVIKWLGKKGIPWKVEGM
jgi:RHS repeat-associated protein